MGCCAPWGGADILMNGACPDCGEVLPSGVRAEFCPVCTLRGARDYEPAAETLGDYDLIEEIGRGGMGVVWRARQRGLGRIVAVKVVLGGDFASIEARERFRAEAHAAARLQHPHIVRIHEIGEADGLPFFSMDYVEGATLNDLARGEPLPARRAAELVHSIALAVQHAHEHGVLHRDLKPSNILIDLSGATRITDFGLAKLLEADSNLTLSGQALGSPPFMPPEQVRRGRATPASDVYSLGAILYYLLTGRPPFQGDSVATILAQVENAEPLAPRRLNPSVPADLQNICLRCLEKAPTARYGTAQALAEDLARFLAGKPVVARPV
ncbi:MAG: serine/threonine-protein kinase, partial [Verrucomicrobiales bacterium]